MTPQGSIAFYDPEANVVTTEPEKDWQTLAFAKAARNFPELQSLAPVRPDHAVTCSECGGSGSFLENTECGTCWGTGWIVK